jgi:hypothetical protein
MQNTLRNFAKFFQDKNRSWISGKLEAKNSMTSLYVKDTARIKFPFPDQFELERLYNLAEPASFGKGQESVLDPSYRSARTLLTDDFAINLRPDHALLNQIKELMLVSSNGNEFVRAELYRVNIYGPGDFFKEHKDTPQAGTGHFGSLVFCLPSQFEGGAFVIRDLTDEESTEVKFDWGSTYASSTSTNSTATEISSAVEYLAFASDLDHWIEPVTSGYRVTITFHLYKESLPTETVFQPLLRNSCVVDSAEMKAIQGLIASKELEGRRVLFPVAHEYSGRSDKEITLKGGDAALFQILTYLELNPKIMFYYDFDEEDYYYQRNKRRRRYDIGSDSDEEDFGEKFYLTDKVYLLTYTVADDNHDDCPIEDIATPYRVIWARDAMVSSQYLSVSPSYGNEPSVEAYSGNVCILTTW